MRWYRLHCIDCRATTASAMTRDPAPIFAEHRVVVSGGVMAAWSAAKKDGFYPLHVIDSDWE